MKRKIISFISLLATAIFCAVCMISCGSDAVKASVTESSEKLLVIQVEESDGKATLKDAMEKLKEDGKIAYEADATGMVISIGETANTTSSFWMLYTSDEDNANTEWGTYTYGEKELGSAVLGASLLVVEKDATYIWVYQTF